MKKIFTLSLVMLTIGQSFGYSYGVLATSAKQTASIAVDIAKAEGTKLCAQSVIVAKKGAAIVAQKSSELSSAAKASYPGVKAKVIAETNKSCKAVVEFAKKDPVGAALASTGVLVLSLGIYEYYKSCKKRKALQRARADLYFHTCQDS